MDRLPPLNQLKDFEAAGRLLSIQGAAEELHVTPAAVSRQVKALEAYLGVRLFVRGHRSVQLTGVGQRYHSSVSASLNMIRKATDTLSRSTQRRTLRIRADTTFSMKWLIPRMSGFHALHPDVDVLLTTSMEMVDFAREDIDAAIRLGLDACQGLVTERLVSNELVPVCSAKFAARNPELGDPERLRHAPLLHSLLRPNDWNKWLLAAGLAPVDDCIGLTYGSSALMYQAAIEGQGIAIARRVLVSNELASGCLVMPFPFVLDEGDYTYYLVYPRTRSSTPEFAAFLDWMRAQAQA